MAGGADLWLAVLSDPLLLMVVTVLYTVVADGTVGGIDLA